MRNCSMCKINNQCNRPWRGIDNPTSCVSFTPIKTNADRIRSMTDEELAKWIDNDVAFWGKWCDALVNPVTHECLRNGGECSLCILEWLKEEAKTDG